MGGFCFDPAAVITELESRIAANTSDGLADLIELYQATNGRIPFSGTGMTNFLLTTLEAQTDLSFIADVLTTNGVILGGTDVTQLHARATGSILIDSIEYEEFHKELLPGLTYIQLDIISPLLLGKPHKDVGIFLQSFTETEYRQKIYIEPSEFIKFRLPDHILTKMKEWNEKIKNANKIVREAKRQQKNDTNQKHTINP